MLEEIVEFYELAIKLKKVKRAGWVQQLQTENVESVADHTFLTALMAMVLADLKGFDTEKIVRMALLHDLEEIIIGDLTPRDKEKISAKELKRMKEDAMKKIVLSIPKKLRPKYLKLMKEHKKYKSKEAKLLNEIENLEMIFQALEYEKDGFDKEKLDEFWEFVPKAVKPEDKDVIKIFETLKKKRKDLQKDVNQQDKTVSD
jgi:putative hydrolase of HD superfamily